MRSCPHCGAPVGVKPFCDYCGNSLDDILKDAVALYKSGILTRNQARIMAGFPAENDDDYIVFYGDNKLIEQVKIEGGGQEWKK